MLKGKDARELLLVVSNTTEHLCELQQSGELDREAIEAGREAIDEIADHIDEAMDCLRLVRGMMRSAEERDGGFWVHAVDWHTIKRAVEESV